MQNIIYYIAGSYLSVTENWIYLQIIGMKKYNPVVYCHQIENLNLYPHKSIVCLNLDRLKRPVTYMTNIVFKKIFGFYPLLLTSFYKYKPLLIHAHFGTSGYDLIKLKKIFKIPLITSFYGFDASMLPKCYPFWVKNYQQLFKIGNLFLVEGTSMRNKLVKLGCTEGKIAIQHLGVDLTKIKYSPRLLKNRQIIKILISASFREKKGITYALKAIARIKQTNPKLKIILSVIGDASKDRESILEKEKIINNVNKYKMKKYIKFLGFVSHDSFIKELYKHHIFLSPSITAQNGDDEGGSPVSITEASASGMPIISTFHCDIPEVVLNNKSGYLVEEKNIDQLVEKLQQLVNNPNLWIKMGKAGRQHIETNYDLKKQINSLEKIYESILS